MQQFHTTKPVARQIFHVLQTCFIQQKQCFAKYFMKQKLFHETYFGNKVLYVKQMEKQNHTFSLLQFCIEKLYFTRHLFYSCVVYEILPTRAVTSGGAQGPCPLQ